MDRYTVFGIEKRFPWLTLTVVTTGVVAAVGFVAAGVWTVAEMCDDHLYNF